MAVVKAELVVLLRETRGPLFGPEKALVRLRRYNGTVGIADARRLPITQSQAAFAQPSIYDRIAFAQGCVESGLPTCLAEKKARECACGVMRDTFSSPV